MLEYLNAKKLIALDTSQDQSKIKLGMQDSIDETKKNHPELDDWID